VNDLETSSGAVLLDTDAFSILHRGGERAAPLRPVVEGALPLLSFVTVGELLRGALQAGWGEPKRTQLQARIDAMTILPYDEVIIGDYARITSWAAGHGHPLGQAVHSNDAWIAATAAAHSVPLVTLNRRHFEGCPGLELLPDPAAAGVVDPEPDEGAR
jgi:predicted nucleic acid-binding protein